MLVYFPALVILNKNSGRWGGGEELTKSGPGDDVFTTTHMLVSGIFRQLTTFVVVLDVVTRFSKIGSVFFFR